MQCAAIIQTAPHGAASGSPRRRATSGPSAPCAPAASTANGASTDGAANITAELASVRRRLDKPEPGRVQELRARQKAALLQILANPPSSDPHTGERK